MCSENTCVHGTCVGGAVDSGTYGAYGTVQTDCSPCEAGWQGEFCDLACDLRNGRVDISLVVDVSGSITDEKRNSLYQFLDNFIRMFDTQSQVRISLVTFSDTHQIHIDPVQHMSSADFATAVYNISK